MELLFLDPVRHFSKKKHELQDAAARSHAAKVSHNRAKEYSKAKTRCSGPVDVHGAATGPVRILEPALSENLDLIPPTSIYPGFGSFRSELLDLLPKEACAADYLALDFFVEVTLCGINVASEMFNISGVYHFLLPNLTTPVSYPAIMALIHLSSSMHCLPELKPNRLMLEHRGRAIEQVRTLLQRGNLCVSEALIVAIVCLSTFESASGRLESYKLHLSALKLLAEEKGHLKLLSGLKIRDMIAMYSDTTLALSTGRSAFKHRQYEAAYPHRPLSAEVQFPPGFADLLHQIPVSQDTISVITNACNLGLDAPCVTLTHSQRVSTAGRRRSSWKYLNYLDSVPVLLEPDDSGVFFEKILVLALSLFAWCGFSTVRSPRFGMYSAMTTQLSSRLVQFEARTEIERHCTAWMWLMVVDAWRIGGNDGTILSQGRDALRHFHQVFLGYRSWANVQKLTRLFFWTGDMENFWSRKWEQLSGEVLSEGKGLTGG